MTKLSLPINGKKLAARWEVETIDLLYIMLNHGLNVVDQYDDEVSIGDVLEDYKKNKDASDYMFNPDEVEDIEAKLAVDDEIPYAETMRGRELMARWDMHDAEIFSIMFNAGLAAIDPFGHELDSIPTFSLLNDNTLDVPGLLFRLSDIEEFETIFDDLEPILHVQDEDSDTDNVEPTPNSEQESIPIISFYKNGDRWLVGEKGKEKTLNHLKGFDFISFLIRHEGKEIDVNVLYDLGKESTEDLKLNVGNVPDGIKILPQEALDMTFQEDGEKRYSLFNDSVQLIVDGQAIGQTKDQINFLKEQVSVERDLDKKLHLKETIYELQQYIKKTKKSPFRIGRFKDKQKDNARTNLRKRIITALNKIYKQAPEISPFLIEIKPKKTKDTINVKGTIKTGYSCWYKHDPSNPVKWVLDPEE